MTLRYSDLAQFFTDDGEYGQLRDIKVSPMCSADWAAFLRWVRTMGLASYFTIGESDEQVPIPEDVEPLVRFPEDGAPPFCIGLALDDLKLRMIGPYEEWLELDFWCDSFRPEHFEPLLSFMQRLGEALDEDVELSPESRQVAMIVYDRERRELRAPRNGRDADAIFVNNLRRAIKDILGPLVAPGGALPTLASTKLTPSVRELRESSAGRAVAAAARRWETEVGSIDPRVLQDQLTPMQQELMVMMSSSLASAARDIEAMAKAGPAHPSAQVRGKYWAMIDVQLRWLDSWED